MTEDKEKEKEDTPEIMQGNDTTQKAVIELKDAVNRPRNSADLSRYQTMEGMQNPEKDSYFTEYINFDDVLRMNTIEAFVASAMLPLKKCSPETRKKVETLLKNMYVEHVKTHKRNMSSLQRKRETAYVRILSSDSNEQSISTGFQKFFGVSRKR